MNRFPSTKDIDDKIANQQYKWTDGPAFHTDVKDYLQALGYNNRQCAYIMAFLPFRVNFVRNAYQTAWKILQWTVNLIAAVSSADKQKPILSNVDKFQYPRMETKRRRVERKARRARKKA